MAAGDIYGDYAKGTRLRLHWEYTQDIANNRDKVTVSVYAQKTSGTGNHHNYNGDSVYWITGMRENALINGNGSFDWADNTELYIGSSTFYNYHNEDGTSNNIAISAAWISGITSSSVVPNRVEAYGTITDIPVIPRGTTVVTDQRAKSVNSISINWYTTDPRDWTRYSLNGGEWQEAYDAVASDNKSGYYIIYGLQPNTTYTIETACRRADSGIWSYSDPITITTFDIAKITAEDFNLGDNFNINITNPSGQAIKFFMETLNGDTIRVEDTTDGQRTITLSDSELDMIYKKMGNGNTVTIRIGVKTIDTYYNYQEKICTLTGNQKTARVNVNENVKRAKAFVNINGVAKRAIVYINDNGVARRCI